MQLGVLFLCALQEENVGVGVFPEFKEIFERSLSVGRIAGGRVGSRQLHHGRRLDGKVCQVVALVEKCPEFRDSFGWLADLQVSACTQRPCIHSHVRFVVGQSGFGCLDGPLGLVVLNMNAGANHREIDKVDLRITRRNFRDPRRLLSVAVSLSRRLRQQISE